MKAPLIKAFINMLVDKMMGKGGTTVPPFEREF